MSAACCASWRFLNESMIFYTLYPPMETRFPGLGTRNASKKAGACARESSLYSRRYFEHDDEVSMSSSMATTSAGT